MVSKKSELQILDDMADACGRPCEFHGEYRRAFNASQARGIDLAKRLAASAKKSAACANRRPQPSMPKFSWEVEDDVE